MKKSIEIPTTFAVLTADVLEVIGGGMPGRTYNSNGLNRGSTYDAPAGQYSGSRNYERENPYSQRNAEGAARDLSKGIPHQVYAPTRTELTGNSPKDWSSTYTGFKR